MTRSIWLSLAMLCCCSPAFSQESGKPSAGQKQQNAASATHDTSAISGDQITKPARAKGQTVTGCLSGPDQDGKFMLRSMSHRSGVEVLGPEALKDDSGAKVKLTGKWEAASGAGMRRFQMTDIEVLSKNCTAPSESTPVSKNKRGKPTTYEAPSSASPQ